MSYLKEWLEKEEKEMTVPENFLNWTMAAMIIWLAGYIVKVRRENRMSHTILLKLKSEIDQFLRPRIVFLIGNKLTRRIRMKDTEKAVAAIELDDAKGFPTGGAFDQAPVWSIDDDTIASLKPSDDGMSCEIAGLVPGNALVSVAGVAAGVSYVGSVPAVVTAGDPTQIKVTLGAAIPQ